MLPVGVSTTQYTTTDAKIGPSGSRIRVYQATWLSDGTARDLVLYNGLSASDTKWVSAAGTISKTTTITFGKDGLVFPSGCFLQIGSAVSANVTYRDEL